MKKLRKHSKRYKRLLTTMVLSALMMSQGAVGYTKDYLYYGNKPFAEMQFLGTDAGVGRMANGKYLFDPAGYELSATLKDATKSATSYWIDILGSRAKNNQPWQIFVTTQKNEQNAYATTLTFSQEEDKKDITIIPENYAARLLQTGAPLDTVSAETSDGNSYISPGTYSVSMILIGQHLGANRDGAIDGWWVDSDNDTVLPQNEQAADFASVIRHELGHALGINVQTENIDENGNPIASGDTPRTERGEYLLRFHKDTTSENSWNMHLVDQNLNPAKPGMQIITTARFEELKANDPTLKKSDFFIVDNQTIDKGLTGAQGNAYFIGDNVTEALGGATMNGVSGLPVKAWEAKYDENHNIVYGFDGSHLETPGMMSHHDYRNYTTFMEVELAAMQDLGYDLDRKAYFGRSIYGDGLTLTNNEGYSARNSNGTAYINEYSTIPLGVGLHIYGSKNNVTQAANILTQGEGAAGVRVDGIENNLAISQGTEIHSDGKNGIGVLVAYGRGHNISHEGVVSASGEGGAGVRFDFGSNLLGVIGEYRGSYIRYARMVDGETGNITAAKNQPLTDMDKFTYNSASDELDGALVENYNLSGALVGGENAIYIGKNAFVKNINIEDGASIKGNITSDWKHFNTDGSYDAPNENYQALELQYGGNNYRYDKYIPDLVTNLNFKGNISYTDNIKGADNMKLNVSDGTLLYGGAADVLNVNVAKDAALYGGTFTVNDMTERMAQGFSDDTTGKFINHGAIGAESADKNMTINGELVSDGYLNGYATGSAGQIKVTGKANIDGSTATIVNAMPGESRAVIVAELVSGDLANENTPYHATGMLDNYGKVTNNTVSVTAVAANNLGNINSRQQETYSAMNNMYQGLDANQREEMRTLYNLSAEDAKTSLSEIGASPAPEFASLVQRSSIVSDVIGNRMNTAFATPSTELSKSTDNNGWVKFTKHWGDMRSGANYHGQAISGGYDRAVGKNWRLGTFISYNAMGFGAESAGGNIYDTRFGFYGGYHNGARDAYVYLDYGWQKNKLRRSVMGMSANADYDSHLIELGGEYKYDLHAEDKKIWHISPFAGLQLSYLHNKGYNETGAGIYNHQVSGKNNTYFAMQTGVEFKRYLKRGSYGMRLGVKHAFSGADPSLAFHYEGDAQNRYTLKNSQDKTHFLLSLSADTEFAEGWQIAGDAGLQKGGHDRDLRASVTLRRVW